MLDDMQQEAAMWLNGPCLSLAGPGSGKTTVLVNRIINLCSIYRVDPNRILVVTFTRDAALEMKERFLSKTQAVASVNFGTFHSIFFNILKISHYIDNVSLINQKNLYSIFQEIGNNLSSDFSSKAIIDESIKEISYVKANNININDYKSDLFSTEVFGKIFVLYDALKKDMSIIDFDDMLNLALEMFKNDRTILEKWQKAFDYILVDEAQDMNLIQYELIKLLGINNNIFLVGDDDQSIYGFRGANPKILQAFTKDFPACKVIYLNNNYRSNLKIVTSALNLISHNKNRFPKVIKAYSHDIGQIEYAVLDNEQLQTKYILEQVEKILNMSDETMGILYRNKSNADNLIKQFKQAGLDFNSRIIKKEPFDCFVWNDFISFLKISLGRGKSQDYIRVVNKPNRFIKRDYMVDDDISLKKIISKLSDKPWIQERVIELEKDFKFASRQKPYAFVNYILKKLKYELYLKEYACENKRQKDDIDSALRKIKSLAKESKSLYDFLNTLSQFEEENNNKEENTSKIFFHTFHGAKGLEFDNVFIIAANEGITPSKKAKTQDEIEEERRMFYVAITRAKKRLFVCSIKKDGSKLLPPSRFVNEMSYFSISEEK